MQVVRADPTPPTVSTCTPEVLQALQAMVAIAEVPGEPGILDELVTSARTLLGARFGIALLVGPDGSPTVMSHQGMTTGEVAAVPHLPGPVGLVGVVLAGQVLRLERMSDHPGSVGLPTGHVAMGALLASPLTVDDAVLGGLYLTRSPGEPAFTAEDETAVRALTRMAGLVVAVRRRITGRRQVLDGLATMGLGLSETSEHPRAGLGGAIDSLLEAARTALGVDVALLSRIGAGEQTVTHVSTGPDAPPLAPGTCFPADEGYCGAMLRGDLPSSVPDTAHHPISAGLAMTAELGVGSYNGVPVTLSDGRVHGTLCTLDRSPTSERDSRARTDSLEVLARLVALHVDRHQADADRRAGDRALLAPLLDGSRRVTVLQPIVDLRSGAAVGHEALSRFTDVHGGALRPDLVFAEAARLDLGVRLEQHALASALQLLPRIPAPAYLSVNLSPSALADPATHDLLSGVPADRLVVEITEHDAVLDYPALARLLGPLRGRGMRIAVDDAGAGFASLQHITQLRPDVVKLDIAFVRDVDTDRNRRAVARALIAYCAETGAVLVAEGVETPAERDHLVALGAVLGQGYLLGRPRPVDPGPPGPRSAPRPAAPRPTASRPTPPRPALTTTAG
ncbi:EAL domain-containing protein [Klenkia sp. LSe6-5]|uniref:EAL domain-containing protein n=1 Tax=Klenkia sesuvii TaxID=3103137 RepID=A0ABU8DVZ3_9ACTN